MAKAKCKKLDVEQFKMLVVEAARDKMWFVVHRDAVGLFTFTEKQPLDGPAFDGHPNRDPILTEFLSIRLDSEQIVAQQDLIRMSSYNWQNLQCGGKMDNTLPKNYTWFLEHIKATRTIGWVDFMSNVCVGVDTSVTVGYMGALYAFLTVSAGWMLNPLEISKSLTRGWIFQECTFCQMDKVMVRRLAEYMKGWKKIGASGCIALCLQIGYLLERRGYDKIFKKEHPHIENIWGPPGTPPGRRGGYFAGDTAEAFRILSEHAEADAKQLFIELKYTGEEDVSWTVKHVIEHCVMDSVDELDEWLCRSLCLKATDIVDSEAEFCKYYSKGILKAFLSSNLTKEEDRCDAITSVACTIMHTLGVTLSAKQLLMKCWDNFLLQLTEFNETWAFPIRSSIAHQRLAFLTGVMGKPFEEEKVWTNGDTGDDFNRQQKVAYRTLGVTDWFCISSDVVHPTGITMLLGCKLMQNQPATNQLHPRYILFLPSPASKYGFDADKSAVEIDV